MSTEKTNKVVTAILQNWSVSAVGGRYDAPEIWQHFLVGKVYSHEKWPDGHPITTSYIDKVDGRLITTRSGSIYQLGIVSQDYLEWCKKNKVHIPTKEMPIKPIEI